MHKNPDIFETVHFLRESAFFIQETNESALRNRIFKASFFRFQIRNMRIQKCPDSCGLGLNLPNGDKHEIHN